MKRIILFIGILGSTSLGAMHKKDIEGFKQALITYSELQYEQKHAQKKEVPNFKQHECVICLESLHNQTGMKTTKLIPCGHEFHTECLIKRGLKGTIGNENTCSLCQTTFEPFILEHKELSSLLLNMTELNIYMAEETHNKNVVTETSLNNESTQEFTSVRIEQMLSELRAMKQELPQLDNLLETATNNAIMKLQKRGILQKK